VPIGHETSSNTRLGETHVPNVVRFKQLHDFANAKRFATTGPTMNEFQKLEMLIRFDIEETASESVATASRCLSCKSIDMIKLLCFGVGVTAAEEAVPGLVAFLEGNEEEEEEAEKSEEAEEA
jgi:hypothetical protein